MATGGGTGRVRWSAYARRLKLFPRRANPHHSGLSRQPGRARCFSHHSLGAGGCPRLRRASTQLLAGGEALGYRPLRQAVAEYLNTSRGVKCSPEQVLIISGVQEALERAAHLLLDPGDPVWVEEPGYPGPHCFPRRRGENLPVPVDAEGLDLELGSGDGNEPKLVYVTPAHQFPLGVTMSLRRRLALLEWAGARARSSLKTTMTANTATRAARFRRCRVWTAREWSFLPAPLTKLYFPRCVWRIWWCRRHGGPFCGGAVGEHAPRALLDQAVLCDFITEGHFARHIRRMRELYAERLGVFLESARSRLGRSAGDSRRRSGTAYRGLAGSRNSCRAAAKEAAKHDVEVIPLSRYASRRSGRQGLLLGFAAVDTRELRRGVEELARALENCRR